MIEVQALFQKLESLLKKYVPFKKYENELNILKRYNEPPHILFMGEFSVGKSSVMKCFITIRDITV